MRAHHVVGLIACSAMAAALACGSDDDAPPGSAGVDAGTPTQDGAARPTEDGATTDGGTSDSAVEPPPTLADGGVVTVAWERGGDYGYRVFRQSDGKILVIARSPYNTDLVLARFLASGALDTTYGKNGYTEPYIARLAHEGGTMTGAALQPDDKLVVTTRVSSGIALMRFATDGTLDPTFGSGGVSYGGFGDPIGLALQPDGKIVVCGLVFNVAGGAGAARYTASGSLDTTFGNQGFATGLGTQIAHAVAIDANGRVLLAGAGTTIGSFGVMRLLANGTKDTTFGTQGITTFPGISTTAMTIAIVGDKIVASGAENFTGSVVRLTQDGQPDLDFDTDGKAGPVGGGSGTDMAVQTDGKIVIGQRGAFAQPALARRFTSAGALDTTFGQDGGAADTKLTAPGALTVAPDGKLLVTGIVQPVNGEMKGSGLAVSRLETNGTLDPAFGTNGVVKTPGVTSADEEGRAVAVQADGKIVVGGDGHLAGVARFLPDGTRDTTFGGDEPGMIVRDLQFYLAGPRITALAIDSAQRIIVAGAGNSPRLLRLTPAGKRDTTFGSSGRADLPISPRALVLLADGRMATAGSSGTSAGLAIMPADGKAPISRTIDASGIGANALSTMNSLGLTSDAKLVAAGSARAAFTQTDVALVRTGLDLVPDPTFDTDGVRTHDLTPLAFEEARALVVLPDGAFVVAGYAADVDWKIDAFGGSAKVRPTTADAFVARFLATGALDTSFATGGVWRSGVGTSVAAATGLLVLPSGQLAVAGRTWTGTREQGFVVRLDATGAPVTSYGVNGVHLFEHGPSSRLHTLATEPGGSLLGVGRAFVPVGAHDLALVRLP